MRITSLYKKRPLLNRLSYWLYDKFCKEPYMPSGKIHLVVKIGNPKCLGWDGRENHATLFFKPHSFIPGTHELFIDQRDLEICG